MRSEEQHIDDFFRKKEEEYQQDTGSADSHWEQMKGLLRQGATPAPRGYRVHTTRRIIKYLGGFTVVTVITLVTLTTIRSKKKVAASKTPTQQTLIAPQKQQPALPALTTDKKSLVQPAKKVKSPVSTAKTTTSRPKPVSPAGTHAVQAQAAPSLQRGDTKPGQSKDESQATEQPLRLVDPQAPKKNLFLAKEEEVRPTADSILEQPQVKTDAANAAAQINAFYRQFDKPANVFLIDVSQESVLNGKEGTRLTIPPFAFSGKKGLIKDGLVTIVLREYYSYEDILSARLSTTSGDEQLISDGMVHVAAHINGDPVNVAAGKSIQLEMPTKKFDEKMQLFRGVRSSLKNTFVAKFMDNRMIDTIRFMKREADENGDIDWIPQGQEQKRTDPLNHRIRVFDPYGDPYRVGHGKKVTAWFYVAKTCPLSNEAMKAKLKEHSNGYFDIIKIKRVNAMPVASYRYQEDRRVSVVGDSVEMTFRQALRKKLLSPEDSILVLEKFRLDSIHLEERGRLMSRYNFTITGLGWYNCDRYNNRGPKTLFTFKPGEGFEPATMVSHLVFSRYRSVLPGTYKDNKICFGKVPSDEPVRIVCIGIKNGKVMSCIRELNTGKEEIGDLAFVETTPEQFRKKLQALNLILP